MYPPSKEEAPTYNNTKDTTWLLLWHALGAWLLGLGDGTCAKNAVLACAAAFISGQLVPLGATDIMVGVDTAKH